MCEREGKVHLDNVMWQVMCHVLVAAKLLKIMPVFVQAGVLKIICGLCAGKTPEYSSEVEGDQPRPGAPQGQG